MNKIFLILFIMLNLASCSSAITITPSGRERKTTRITDLDNTLDLAEENASDSGRKILKTSREMIANKDVIVGGCWNYINAVYDRVGYTNKLRTTVFKSKYHGPYVSQDKIQAGDWLYFVNHTYSDSEHSAIFVAWTNENKNEAIMVSYVGGSHKKPATYKKFILDKIYSIIRGSERQDIETAYSH